MSGQSFPRVPVNPRLEFGVPLERVYEKAILHPGLRELFLKAYLSAAGDGRIGEEQFKGLWKTPYVLQALKAGPKGQGLLADRISLKLKLESGTWIIATQTPAGAPLWLLRHFLGCLPRPLLHGSYWRQIAVACGDASRPKGNHHEGEVLDRIVVALEALPTENYLILVALVLLIRNLSAVTASQDSALETLHEEAVEALSQYFTAAIISRPYRPGLYTMLDNEHKPLLVFLSEHWLEVKELSQHSGISSYHSTCESRYEFANPDTEVGHTMWQAMATAKDIDDEIDVLESLTRKSNQQLPQFTNPHTSLSYSAGKEARTSKKEARRIDFLAVPNIQETETQGYSVPVTVRMPKGVYFISSNDSSDIVESSDKECDHGYVQPDVPKADYFRCHFLPKVVKDKGDNNPNFDAKKLISKFEHEAMVFTGIHRAVECDDLPLEKEVTGTAKVRINGTQTFQCEFFDDNEGKEVEKLQERINEVRVSPAIVEVLKNSDTQQTSQENILAVVNIGPSNVLEFSKICDKNTVVPLIKSTALLIENLISDEGIVYFPARQVTRSDVIDLPNGKVINEVEPAPTPKEDAFDSKAYKDVRTLTNPFKNVNKWRDQQKSSNYNDFVSELKNNFKQGRKKPSDTKLSSRVVLADYSGQDVATTTGRGSSKVLRIAQFLCEKVTHLRGLAESNSTQELFPNTSCAPVSSANSI